MTRNAYGEQLALMPICNECGDDVATEGHVVCVACLELAGGPCPTCDDRGEVCINPEEPDPAQLLFRTCDCQRWV